MRIEGEHGLQTISALREDLLASIAGGGPVMLDLSAVESVDLSFLQMIEAARREAARSGVAIALSSPASRAIQEALEMAGFLGPQNSAATCFWTQGGFTQ